MSKRMTFMLLAVAVFVTAIGYVKFAQVQAAISQASSFRPPPEAVTTIVAEEQSWESTLGAIGSVSAIRGVTVSADLPGIVVQIAFESGRAVREGDVLVRLDTRQEQAQLTAAEAERDLARQKLERMRGLRQKGVTSEQELDTAEAEFKMRDAKVGEIRATIDRKTIRAPFSGILGIRQADLGQYLQAGDPVVPLQSLHPIFVDFAVPQQEVARLQTGTEVRVAADGSANGEAGGRVTAVDSIVDEATRNVQVQATLPNADGRLRPGMFVETRILLDRGRPVVPLPASSISYAPYGDSVYVVEEIAGPDGARYRGVRQQFVKLGVARGDQIAILSGIRPGEEVVTSGVFKLRNGAAVRVENGIQLANDPAPDPEEG